MSDNPNVKLMIHLSNLMTSKGYVYSAVEHKYWKDKKFHNYTLHKFTRQKNSLPRLPFFFSHGKPIPDFQGRYQKQFDEWCSLIINNTKDLKTYTQNELLEDLHIDDGF